MIARIILSLGLLAGIGWLVNDYFSAKIDQANRSAKSWKEAYTAVQAERDLWGDTLAERDHELKEIHDDLYKAKDRIRELSKSTQDILNTPVPSDLAEWLQE